MTDERKYCVYIHTSPSGKYYVGITCQKPNERWQTGGNGYRECPRMWNAIQKYGWDNFEHEIIASNIDEHEAKEFEKKLIETLKSYDPQKGYNISHGGDGVTGIHRYGEQNSFYGKEHTSETRTLLSKLKKNKPTVFHCDCTEETKKEISLKHSKPILQYDLSMNLVAEYKNTVELEALGFRRASIRDVCMGRKQQYKDYIWKFKNETDKIGYVSGSYIGTIICIKEIDMSVIKFKSYSEASKFLNISRRRIANACKSTSHICDEYMFFHELDYIKYKEEKDDFKL